MTSLHVLNGPQTGKSFTLRDGVNYIGRSSQDIQIDDPTISRQHLKITSGGGRYYIKDMKSRNGTFFNGSYLSSAMELEVKEGIPIAIGMTVICIGQSCLEEMTPFLDSVGLSGETGNQSGFYGVHKDKTNQKKLELLYKVSDVLGENLPVGETCKRILDHIFDLLKKIDRAIIILIDPVTKEITKTISESKPNIGIGDTAMSPLRDIVQKVMATGKPLVISNVETERDELADTLKILNIQSLMCVPMTAIDEIVGFLYIDSLERPYGFRLEDVSLFMDLGRRIAIAVQYSRFAAEASMGNDNVISIDA